MQSEGPQDATRRRQPPLQDREGPSTLWPSEGEARNELSEVPSELLVLSAGKKGEELPTEWLQDGWVGAAELLENIRSPHRNKGI